MSPMTSLLGALGLLALAFALISFLVQLFSGLALRIDELYWSLGNLVVGLVLIGIAVGTGLEGLRERMSSGEARRAGKYGTSAILSTVLLVALLAGLAFLSTRYHTRFDWTEASTHSITSQTQKVLDGLDRDVQITALYASVAAPPVRDFLQRFEFASDRVKVEFVDPQAQPGRLRDLGIDTSRLEGGVLHVDIAGESVQVSDVSEAELTNAIVKLTRLDQKKVYFLEGHNERRIEGDGAEDGEGFAFAKEALENENYVVESLLLAARGEVPEDANVVVLAGPTRPLHESEHQALQRWVDGGGAVLVLIDPRARTDLAGEFAQWGVDVGDDVVLDRLQGLFGRPATPFAASYGAHPITAELREASLFHVARSVTVPAGSPFETIVSTGEESWGERDLDRFYGEGEAELGADDLPGPVSVAVAGEVRPDGVAPAEGDSPARMVVFGDADFASNQLINEFQNRDLFVNSVNWLLGDVEAISVRPGQARASRIQLSSEQFMQIRYLSLFVLPELIAAFGVYAWWSRRRAPGR